MFCCLLLVCLVHISFLQNQSTTKNSRSRVVRVRNFDITRVIERFNFVYVIDNSVGVSAITLTDDSCHENQRI